MCDWRIFRPELDCYPIQKSNSRAWQNSIQAPLDDGIFAEKSSIPSILLHSLPGESAFCKMRLIFRPLPILLECWCRLMYVPLCYCSSTPTNNWKTGHGGDIKGPTDKSGKHTKAEPFVFHSIKCDNSWGDVAAGAWKTVGDKCNDPPPSLIFSSTKVSLSPGIPSNHHVRPSR